MAGSRVVVIGGVAAGMSAASQAARRQPDAHVIVLEEGDAISYAACGMPYNIGDADRDIDDLIVLTPEDARADRDIDVRLHHRAVELDLDRAQVVVRDESSGSDDRIGFDAAVLASGARAIRPPIDGIDADGVFVLRTLAQGRRLKAALDDHPSDVVIVGGGYVGMEMAHVLTDRGAEVTVVEREQHILPGWGDEVVGEVHRTLENHGVRVLTGSPVDGIETSRNGRATAVITTEKTLRSDLVLVAVGIRPEVELAREAGLRIGDTGAVWVDQWQQTSHPAVFAAGDCAEAFHRVLRRNAWIPLGTTANKQGRAAGANAIGARERFRGVVGTQGFVVFDLEVARTGLGLDEARDEGFEPVAVTIRQRSRGHRYPGGSPVHVTLVADRSTGMLLGAEIAGRDGAALRINVVAAALAAHLTVADLQQLDLVYAPPFAPTWDPVLVAANQLVKKVESRA